MFEGSGQDLLRVSWQGPGMAKKALIGEKAFFH
jgi:hypothetical protein